VLKSVANMSLLLITIRLTSCKC